MPRFSIVIPSYGNAAHIANCLGSLQSQEFTDWEAIVIDDAGPDDSANIVARLSQSDPRIKQYLNGVNKGRHVSRMEGVGRSTGDYILFLDSDDEFCEGFLGDLASVLPGDARTVVHFGIKVIGESEGLDQRTAAFESHANADFSDLYGDDLRATVFNARKGFVRDWRITQRAFPSFIAKRGFASMCGRRLEMAEDGYEYFVLSSFAQREITHNEIVGYRYYLGRGSITDGMLSRAGFILLAGEYAKSYQTALVYADTCNSVDMHEAAEGFRLKLIEALMNDWHERVSEKDRLPVASELVEVIGSKAVATHLMRFVRDDSYSMIMGRFDQDHLSELLSWKRLAEELSADQAKDMEQYRLYAAAADDHLRQLEAKSDLKSMGRDDIRIFVCTHKDSAYFDSDILQPIQVGSAIAPYRLGSVYHDDRGENISELNPMYCELTAQYWAWRNIDAEYYGFCHYRRYFDFSPDRHVENVYGEVIDDYIDAVTQAKYCLDDDSIEKVVRQYDVITTEIKDLAKFPGNAGTPLRQYHAAPRLIDADLDRAIAILKEMHPDYAQDADSFLNGSRSCFCNMFIMRKDIFFDYCAWLFPMLERFVERTDMSLYSKEALRTPGHLSERLFNIYYQHHMRQGSGWRTKQLQCVRFMDPERVYGILPPSDAGFAPIVPVVFAADGNYVHMLSSTIHSMMANASPDRYYDILVLERGISTEDKRVMQQVYGKPGKVSLRFHNVRRIIESFDLATNNAHISIETYYRFLVQQLLPHYGKVLYLDSDLIVQGDVAQLYDTDLGDNLLAAVRDLDFLGNVNMKGGERLRYAKEVLGMDDPYAYFQAGVLLLNTDALRELHTVREWLDLASDARYIYNDQDILNAECEGRVHFLDYRWNVMTDCAGRIEKVFSFAPSEAYEAYLKSREDQLITHYAGFEKPWKMKACDRAPLYWKYARQTPFYERLIRMLCAQAGDETYYDEHEFVIDRNNPMRKFIDPIMPYGSRRREVVKGVVRKIRGRK